MIGKVTYTYNKHTVGSADIIYDTTDTGSHLDDASREIVDTEIQQIKTNNKNHAFLLQKMSAIKYGWLNLVSFFQERLILLIVLVLILLLLILLIVNYRLHRHVRRRKNRGTKRRKPSGGMSINSRNSLSFGKRGRGRKRHGIVDYTTSGRKPSKRARETSSNMSARRLKKNRKKTKESFGKSFYDF